MMCNPVIYPNFSPVEITASIPNDILTFRAHNNIFRNYKTVADDDFTLTPQQVRNGGKYQLLVKKDTAADVEVTLPAGSIVLGDPAATTITLSGAQDEEFLIDFTHSGTGYVFWLESSGSGSQVAPGQPSAFSPNVIPFINASGEWAEDTDFTYNPNTNTMNLNNFGVNSPVAGGISIGKIQTTKLSFIRFNANTSIDFVVQPVSSIYLILSLSYNPSSSPIIGGGTNLNFGNTKLNILSHNIQNIAMLYGSAPLLIDSERTGDKSAVNAKFWVRGESDITGNAFSVSSLTLTNKLLNVANNGNINIAHRIMVGDISASPTATIDISNPTEPNRQLRIRNKYTPAPSDPNMEEGSIAWDDTNFYIKNSLGEVRYVPLQLWS